MNDKTKTVPADIREVYGMLSMLNDDLTDVMQIEVTEWKDDLKTAVSDWKRNGAKEPNWKAYRNAMNEICREDGMPRLFG